MSECSCTNKIDFKQFDMDHQSIIIANDKNLSEDVSEHCLFYEVQNVYNRLDVPVAYRG